jgi:hypothetical protein
MSSADPGFYVRRAHFLARGQHLGPLWDQGSARYGGGAAVRRPRKLLGIRKYRTSFLNRNWLKLYHVRHDASHRRHVQWSMIFYSWRKVLLRLQYEEQKSEAFSCSRKICVILFKRERTNSCVWNSIRKGKMDISQTEWKRTGEKYSQLTLHAWLSENRDVCFKIDQ